MAKCKECGRILKDNDAIYWICPSCRKVFNVSLLKLKKIHKQRQLRDGQALVKCPKCGVLLDNGNEKLVSKCVECGNATKGNLEYFITQNENKSENASLNKEKKRCKQCGKELQEGLKFCPNCGLEVGTTKKPEKKKNLNKKAKILIGALIALVVFAIAIVLISKNTKLSKNEIRKEKNITSSEKNENAKKMKERIDLSAAEKIAKMKEYISDRIDNGDDITTYDMQRDTIKEGFSCHSKKSYNAKEFQMNGIPVAPYLDFMDEANLFNIELYLTLDVDNTLNKLEIYNTTQSVHYNSTSMSSMYLSQYGGEGINYSIDLASANDKEDHSEKLDSLYEIFNSQEEIYINLIYTKDGVETLTVTDYLKKIMLIELECYKESLTYLPNEIKYENTTEEVLPTPVIATDDSAKKIKFGQAIKTDFVKMKLTGSKVARKFTPSGDYWSYKQAGADSKYVYITGNIKNLSNTEISLLVSTYINFCFDNQYEYRGHLAAEGHVAGALGSDYTDFIYDMKALQKSKMYLFSEVPNEIANKYKTCTVTFGFQKNFEGLPSKEKDCDYLYEITIKR